MTKLFNQEKQKRKAKTFKQVSVIYEKMKERKKNSVTLSDCRVLEETQREVAA